MKIAIGKTGKSILFGKNSTSKNPMTSGSDDARIIFKNLIKHNPQHEFYLIGKSDFARLSEYEQDQINVHGNLHDPWMDFKKWKKKYKGLEDEAHVKFLDEWRERENIKMDCGVFLPGHMLTYAVAGKTQHPNGSGRAKTLVASYTYAGAQFSYLNETKLPYIMIVTDPRCYPGTNYDCMVPPKLILSQYNENMTIKHMIAYDDPTIVEEQITAIYSGVESLYLVEEDQREEPASLDDLFGDAPVVEPTPERDIQMILFLNEGRPSRYRDVMEYVLGKDNQIKIYGSWSQDVLDNDDRFEAIPMKELSHLFPRIKYTFCIPIKKGWATGKFWDSIKMGIVPFVHPEYDTQKNIGFPEFLRVRDAEDLQNKMNFLDANPHKYNELWDNLRAMMTPERQNGKFLSDMIMNSLEAIV